MQAYKKAILSKHHADVTLTRDDKVSSYCHYAVLATHCYRPTTNKFHKVMSGRHGCGRHGHALWPISFVAEMVVADVVCGRYGCGQYGHACGRYGLWPI